MTSFHPWLAHILFLNTPKSYHHRNSSVAICIFSGCWAGSTPWIIAWKIPRQGWCPAPSCAAVLHQHLCSSSTLTSPAKLPFPVIPGMALRFHQDRVLPTALRGSNMKTPNSVCLFFFCWYSGWGGKHIRRGLADGSAELCASHPFALSPSFSHLCSQPAIPFTYFHTDLETWPGPRWGYRMKFLIIAPIVFPFLGDISTFPKILFPSSLRSRGRIWVGIHPQGWSVRGTEQGELFQGEFYQKIPTNHSSPGPLGRLGVSGQTQNTCLSKPHLLRNAAWICKVPLIRVVLCFLMKLTDSRHSNRK